MPPSDDADRRDLPVVAPPSGVAPAGGSVVAGRYEVLGPLGRGSFGHTLLAHDREANRKVALKRLDARAAADWKAFELFEREALVLRDLRHPGIPAVYASIRDTWDGAPAAFLVLEFIEGRSLAAIIEDGGGAPEPLALLLDLLGILEYLHGRVPPILHRDIKPANIIIRPDGSAALVDFGSVRHVHMGPDESGSTVAGTYGYMPYEQYMGQASPASDLYALGATMLHLLTGRPPREFMSSDARLEVPAGLPGDPRLAVTLTRMLRAAPAERFASAREARQALLAPPSESTALVIGGERRPAQRRAALPPALPPAPRPLEGPTRALVERNAPSMWALMDASSKPTTAGVTDWLLFGFLSVVTAGVLPAVFFAIARARRRRLTLFARLGMPGIATVQDMALESTAFGEKLMRVRYEFVADGQLHRDADQVLPVIANRWRAGDEVQILYLPDRDYDSLIVSAG